MENRVKIRNEKICIINKEKAEEIVLTREEYQKIHEFCLMNHDKDLILDRLTDKAADCEVELSDKESRDAVEDLYQHMLDFDKDVDALNYEGAIEDILQDRDYELDIEDDDDARRGE